MVANGKHRRCNDTINSSQMYIANNKSTMQPGIFEIWPVETYKRTWSSILCTTVSGYPNIDSVSRGDFIREDK